MERDDLNRRGANDDLEPSVVAWASVFAGVDAELTAGLLRSAGIPVHLADSVMRTVRPQIVAASGGQRVMVPRNRLAEALQILASTVSDDELEAQALAAAASENDVSRA